LTYSETRPDFIRALLEHVGAEINPIRLISRIRNGLEIPGLKAALIKVLQASNLQISLLEGCQDILNSDCSALASQLQTSQSGSTPVSGMSFLSYRVRRGTDEQRQAIVPFAANLHLIPVTIHLLSCFTCADILSTRLAPFHMPISTFHHIRNQHQSLIFCRMIIDETPSRGRGSLAPSYHMPLLFVSELGVVQSVRSQVGMSLDQVRLSERRVLSLHKRESILTIHGPV